MPSPNLSEIVATTLRNRSGKLADNVTENNALLARLKKKGKVKPFSGGRTIVEELEYAENGTYKRYSGYDVLDISPQDVFTAAEFDIKQIAISVSISGLEGLQNSGSEAVIDLLESRVENAERSMMNGIAADVYSDGTADGGKQIGGLQHLVADDPTTGVVGGINRANWTFWQNGLFDISVSGSGSASSSNIQSYMNATALPIVRGRDHADLIVADQNFYKFYLESLQTIQRITDVDTAGSGFASLKYYGAGFAADVVLDGGVGGNCPANHMYFLNTDHICFRPHRDRNMTAIGGERFSTNQDAMVKIVGWAGNMTLRGAKYQSVLIA